RAQGTLGQVLGGEDGPATEVRARDPERLISALQSRGHNVQRAGDVLSVMGTSPEQVGEIAGQEGVAVLGLAAKERSLEEAFLSLTGAAS
ncbi:MAG: ABC transporter ATP-binding protein, partial [Solirubrobacteraceae bacterium]